MTMGHGNSEKIRSKENQYDGRSKIYYAFDKVSGF